jgi:hypothetical protein
MRFIQVPAPVQLKHIVSGEDGDVVTFPFWVIVRILTDVEHWGKTGEAQVMAGAIRRALLADEEVVGLEDAAWEKLKAAVSSPSVPYEPASSMQISHFIEAIFDAGRTDPRGKSAG